MLTITNKELIYTDSYNKEDKDKVLEKDFLYYLSDTVEFSENLTFERFFKLIIQHKEILNVVFHRALGGYKIENFIQDFEGTPEKDNSDFDLTISISTDYYINKDGNEFSYYYDFGGYGVCDCIKEKDPYGISVSMSKLKNIKKKILKLDDKISVHKLVKNNYKCIVDAINSGGFKLFDVIYAVLFEISFHGTPEDREIVSDDLKESVEGLEVAMENGTLDELTVPVEEVILNVREKEMEKAIREENYERAGELKKEIEILKKHLKKHGNK